MKDIVSPDAPEDIYITPVGCYGIVRRKNERKSSINPRLEEVLLSISSQMPAEEIEKRSRVQRRGRYSEKQIAEKASMVSASSSNTEAKEISYEQQLSLFDFVNVH